MCSLLQDLNLTRSLDEAVRTSCKEQPFDQVTTPEGLRGALRFRALLFADPRGCLLGAMVSRGQMRDAALSDGQCHGAYSEGGCDCIVLGETPRAVSDAI